MGLRPNLFEGKLVRLAAPRPEDVATMALWMEDSDYLRNVDTEYAVPATEKQMESESEPGSKEVYFRLRELEGDELIGFAAIHSIEWNNRAGMLAIGIGEAQNRGRGYGSDALKILLRYAFHELNLHRVGLDVIEYNAGGIRAYEKGGFRHEGRAREAVWRDGRLYDRISMGILRREWEAALES